MAQSRMRSKTSRMIDPADHICRWHDHGIGIAANLDSKPYDFKKEFSLCISLLLIQPLVLPASYICFIPYYPFSSVSVIPPGPTPKAGLFPCLPIFDFLFLFMLPASSTSELTHLIFTAFV